MNFDLTPEQQLLKDTLRRLLNDHYGLEARRTYANSADGFSRAMWSRYAEMGLLALPYSQELGGLEASPAETLVTMQEMGRALVLEPYLETVVICGGLIRRLAPAQMQSAVIPKIADGSLVLAFGHEGHEPPGSYVDAEQVEGGYRLRGRVPVVIAGATSQQILVPAKSSGGRVALLLVDRSSEGLSPRAFPLHDGTRAAELRFSDVMVQHDRLVSDDGYAGICRVTDEANAALCAEIVGAMEEAFELTRHYVRTRQQFGAAIGTFQAVRHRLADMVVALEHARSMAILAIMRCGSENPIEREGAVSAAKIHIAGAARALGQSAIQLHGGIGMTEEYKLGHLFKRMEALGKRLGDPGTHLSRLAVMSGPMDTVIR